MAPEYKTHEFQVADQKFTIINDAADTLLAGSLEAEHTWEPWQIYLYSKLIKPGAICLDIGANIGTSALAMAYYAKGGKVFSFEPVKTVFEILATNIAANGALNVKPINLGLSNQSGEATFLVDRTMLGAAHRIINRIHDGNIGEKQYTEKVQLQRLDDWVLLNSVERFDLIKVDVEGSELEIIEGGQKTFFASSHTVAIFEFGVFPQRVSSQDQTNCTISKDVAFFRKLQTSFAHVFLIGRDARLYKIDSYAHLRFLMLKGYPVEDLLCCQIIPRDIVELMAPSAKSGYNLPVQVILSARCGAIAVTYNRGEDGWTLASPAATGTRSVTIICCPEPLTLQIDFAAVSGRTSGFARFQSRVSVDDRHWLLDLIDRPSSVQIPISAGTSYIFIETDNSLSAQSYFGSSTDTRSIGVRFNLSDFESLF